VAAVSERENSRPTPDPTVLTTEQLERAIENVTKLLESRIKAVDDGCTLRFETVKGQFVLVERQRVEQKEDTTRAVEAAFSAAKEGITLQTTASERAITKSETAMLEQLKQLGANFKTEIKGVTDGLGEVKDRVSKIESLKQGGKEQLAAIYALAGFLVALLVIGGVLAASGAFGK
jgi:hypothetical protein